MQLWQAYHTPATVEEALALLASYDGGARVIAGGTDLLIDLQFEENSGGPLAALVDVTRIAEMASIDVFDGVCTVGAAVTHTAITESAAIEAGATCLVESCGVVGGPESKPHILEQKNINKSLRGNYSCRNQCQAIIK